MVFAAATDPSKSLNREAIRLMENLCDPEQTTERLLEILTFRQAGGLAQVVPDRPTAAYGGNGAGREAEKFSLRVSDGHGVAVLFNATPALSEEVAVESFIVTHNRLVFPQAAGDGGCG